MAQQALHSMDLVSMWLERSPSLGFDVTLDGMKGSGSLKKILEH